MRTARWLAVICGVGLFWGMGCAGETGGSPDESCAPGAEPCVPIAGSMAGHGGGAGGASGAGAGVGVGGAGGDAGASGAAGAGAGGSTTAGSGGDSGSGGSMSDGGMPSSGCGASTWPQDGTLTLDVEGTQRTYIVELPDGYDPNTAYKLVFAWHGFTGMASQVAANNTVANHGRFFALQPRAGGSAIFVAPQGLETMLLGQSGPGWDNMNGRDVKFALAMLDSLRASYCIDNDRVFSAGVSMGGYFTNQLACEVGEHFRAVASIIGGGPIRAGGVTCQGPKPVWITHGTMDQINPYAQGEASRDYWIGANHCDSTSTPVAPADCVSYDGCDDGYPVHFCSFEGDHVIPDFAPEGIWNFFSQF